MDTEGLSEVVSTAVILGGLGFLVAPTMGYESIPARVGVAAVGAVVVGLPIAAFMVYVYDGEETHFFGPWGPEDLVFLIGALPLLVGVWWVTTEYDLAGAVYWVVVLVGVLAAVVAGAHLRSATIGEWPPGPDTGREREGGPPGGGR